MNPNLLIREAQSSEYETVANLTMAAYRPLFTELDLPEDLGQSGLLQDHDLLTWGKTQRLIESFEDGNVLKKFLTEIEIYGEGKINYDFMKLRLFQLKNDEKEVARIAIKNIKNNGHLEISQKKEYSRNTLRLKLTTYIE